MHYLIIVFCFFIGIVSRILWRLFNVSLRDKTLIEALPPGSFGLPIIGETHLFLIYKSKFFERKREQNGPIYKTHLFGRPTIRLTNAKDINKILKDCRRNLGISWPKSAHALLKGGLALETSEILHKTKRKIFLRAFSNEALSRYTCIMMDLCEIYVTKWTMTSEPVYLYPEMRKLAFQVACNCLLGFQPSQNELEEFMVLFKEFVSGMFSVALDVSGFAFSKALRARHEIMKKIESFLHNQNERLMESRQTVQMNLQHCCTEQNIPRCDIPSMCLELLFAGHETTASAATTMIINVCENPDVFGDVINEVTNISRTHLTHDVISSLNYVDAVVKETLRLNPPIGAGYRRVTDTIRCNGFQIPKDWTLIYGIRDSHESSNLTPSPDKFHPARWFHGEEEFIIKEGFLAFGAGRHKCVGRHFAVLFLKVLLFVLAKNARFKMVSDQVHIKRFPVPHPNDDLPVVFQKV